MDLLEEKGLTLWTQPSSNFWLITKVFQNSTQPRPQAMAPSYLIN